MAAVPLAPHRRRHIAIPRGTFGEDRFGRLAERFARLFGTPAFLVSQTVVVAGWLVLNAASWGPDWDPYPFILLNLLFSTQAAYAAPLILLAQTREADRDRAEADAHNAHSDAVLASQVALLRHHEQLTERVVGLTGDLDRLAADLRRALPASEPSPTPPPDPPGGASHPELPRPSVPQPIRGAP